jgi:hypothetical protein
MYQAPQHHRPARPGLSAATAQAQRRLRLIRAQRGQTRLDEPNREVDLKTAAGMALAALGEVNGTGLS